MLTKAFNQLDPISVLVLGDFMVDRYVMGNIERISPEAPVPVMHVREESSRAGGAGNVALNLVALGADVQVVGMVGQDLYGRELQENLSTAGVNIEGLFLEKGLKTTVKTRLISSSQHLMRLDHEEIRQLNASQIKRVIAYLEEAIKRVNIIALSDYFKGFFSPKLLKSVMKMAKDAGVKVIVDPKGDDFTKYRGATIVKPNQKEAYLASKLPKSAPINEVAKELIEQAGLENLIITRSEKGISLFPQEGGQKDFPVQAQEVIDVTGAGDTVLAMLAYALGNGLSVPQAIELANLASGIAIGRLGCVHVTLSEVASRLLESATDNKIFEEHHLYPLIQVLKHQKYIIVAFEHSIDRFNLPLLEQLRSIRERHPQARLIAYIEEEGDGSSLASLFCSFKEIDFVILKQDDLSDLCDVLNPEAVYLTQGEFIESLSSVNQVFERTS